MAGDAVSTTLLTALSATLVRPRLAIEVGLSPALRLWTGVGDLTLDGATYAGSGSLLSVEGLGSDTDLSVDRLAVRLQGIASPEIALADVIGTEVQGRVVSIWLLAMDEADSVADSVLAFRGLADTLSISDSGREVTVELVAENELASMERVRGGLFTGPDQRERYSTDSGLDQVEGIQDLVIVWGPGHETGAEAGKTERPPPPDPPAFDSSW